MSAAENQIVDAILTYLELSGIYAWRNNNTPVYDAKKKTMRQMPKGSLKGVPDILGIFPDGRFLGIECKTKTGRPTINQKRFIEIADRLNAVCFVARGIKDVERELRIAFDPASKIRPTEAIMRN